VATETLQLLEEIAYLASCAVSGEEHRRLDLALQTAGIDDSPGNDESEASTTVDARPRLAA